MSVEVRTLDLNFQGLRGAIAAYLIPHRDGAVLVECGPGSTLESLRIALAEHGYQFGDVTDLLLTHIHLDHAGAAGWLARQGTHIHVHPNGAPHLLNPEKLINSAGRIYGDRMETLWGEFLSVPEAKLSIPRDGDGIDIGEHSFQAVNTPGHANHHYAYLLDDIAFVGDVGGVRMDAKHLRLPMPPPEFNIELWRGSVQRLSEEFERAGTRRIAPTHFGVYTDPDWQLTSIQDALDEVEGWMESVMPGDPPIEALRSEFTEWAAASRDGGLGEEKLAAQEAVNPAFMSADGIQRYWRKYRADGVAGA